MEIEVQILDNFGLSLRTERQRREMKSDTQRQWWQLKFCLRLKHVENMDVFWGDSLGVHYTCEGQFSECVERYTSKSKQL